MIINKKGAHYEAEGKTFVIGEQIYVTDESDYKGLFGTVIEIRDGDDKETENETVDIYCALDEPVLLFDREQFENRFSALYGQEKRIEDITFDLVILSPDMVVPIKSLPAKTDKIDLYIVQEECCDGDVDVYSYYFTDYISAKQKFNELLSEDFRNGYVCAWRDNDKFKCEYDNDYYEAWIDGCHCEKHYMAKIICEPLCISKDAFNKIGETYINEYLRTCFKEQTEQWDDPDKLSDNDYEKLLSSEELPYTIKEKLENDEAFLEKFWEAFSCVCFEIFKEKGESSDEKK